MKWSYEFVEYGGYDCMTDAFFVRNADERIVTVVDQAQYGQKTNGRPFRSGEAEAVARLIAAAPDLLEALKGWQAVCECETPEQDQAYGIAAIAIAKAEGTDG